MERSLVYRFAGWSACLSGFAAVLTLITVPIFIAVGLPYDLISSSAEIIWFALIIPIAIAFHQQLRSSAWLLSLIALVIGIVGLIYSTVVTFLLNFGSAGFGDSGIFLTATIGFWFLMTSSLFLSNKLQPRGLSWLGILIGASYMMGLLGLLFMGSLIMIFGIHVLVVTLLYPIWAIWTGRVLLNRIDHKFV